MGPSLKVAFTFPLSWINDTEQRKYLSENLARLIKKGSVKNVYQTSATDKYFASQQSFITGYYVRLKYHAYQPVKIKMTQSQMGSYLKPIYPNAKCIGFDTFFIQAASPTQNPFLECEIYY